MLISGMIQKRKKYGTSTKMYLSFYLKVIKMPKPICRKCGQTLTPKTEVVSGLCNDHNLQLNEWRGPKTKGSIGVVLDQTKRQP